MKPWPNNLPEPTFPQDNWIRYQVQSMLNLEELPSLEKAKELWEQHKYDRLEKVA